MRAAGQLQAPRDTDQGALRGCGWERPGGRVQCPELKAEGIDDFPGQQGHQASVQACVAPCEAGGHAVGVRVSAQPQGAQPGPQLGPRVGCLTSGKS